MGRVTEFMHYINIDRKNLKLGQNMKSEDYKFITIKMKTKRARYEHQCKLKKEEKENK